MHDFRMTFYGVGGSTATSSRTRVKYGSNTSCALLQAGERLIILDMGTGLSHLANALEMGGEDKADILLSHFHYDHIEGFPFFNSFFQSGDYKIYGEGRGGKTPEKLLHEFMAFPYFPITSDDFSSKVSYIQFGERDRLNLGDGILVSTMHTNHPGFATAYRIEFEGKSVVQLLDHEHGNPEIDREIVKFCKGTQVLIYDAHFTADEYDSGLYCGWGHSTHREGAILANEIGVEKLVLTHHAPWRTDEDLDRLEEKVIGQCSAAIMAREGLVIML